MQFLRAHRLIRWLVPLWFALTLGAAIASPLLQPQTMELVCSSHGAMRLIISHDGATGDASAHTLDCALCLLAGPPSAALPRQPWQPPSLPLPAVRALPVVALAGAALPARGPPPQG